MTRKDFRKFWLGGVACSFAAMFFIVVPYLEATQFDPRLVADKSAAFLGIKWFVSFVAAAFMLGGMFVVEKAVFDSSN